MVLPYLPSPSRDDQTRLRGSDACVSHLIKIIKMCLANFVPDMVAPFSIVSNRGNHFYFILQGFWLPLSLKPGGQRC